MAAVATDLYAVTERIRYENFFFTDFSFMFCRFFTFFIIFYSFLIFYMRPLWMPSLCINC
jgi:hypothetical protein